MTEAEELIQIREEHRVLRERVEQRAILEEHLRQLSEEVKRLQARVAKESQKSSLPPSSDRCVRQKTSRSLRQKSGRRPGGQPGHPAHHRQMAEPTDVIHLPPATPCPHWQAEASDVAVKKVECCYVIDVPPLPALQVTQDVGEWKVCPHCHYLAHATFPDEVAAPVQYGPRLSVPAAYVRTQQLMPRRRWREILEDQCGIHMSEAMLSAMITRAASQLEPIERQIITALKHAPVLHQDETGLSVLGKRIWLHVTSTPCLTHDQVHARRGRQALDALGILTEFPGTPPPKGKRGRGKQHPAHNLLTHIRKHQQAVWACMENLAMPFDNTLAERDLRMKNVQQKVSGTFRSDQGAVSFARIRGSLSTMRTQGQRLFSVLEATLLGHPPLPSFEEN